MRRILPLGLLLLGLAASPALAQPEPDPPNIIFIMFDDLGYSAIQAFRALDENPTVPLIETPVMDNMADQGLMMTQYYANAPVCSPTRSAVLSGRYPADLGIRSIVNKSSPNKGVPADIVDLPALLQGAGYYTGHFGKWHLGGSAAYPEFRPTSKGYNRTVIKAPGGYFAGLRIDSPTVVTPSGGVHLTERLITQTIQFVDDALVKINDPTLDYDNFFINLWLLAPHAPYCEVPNGATFATEFEYHAELIRNADEQIGRLIDDLKARNLLNNTLIVVTSDNGGYPLFRNHAGLCATPANTTGNREFLTNGPLRAGKGQTFEGGIKVPMIVHWPAQVAANTESDAPIMTFDLFPTFAELAQVQALPQGLRGASFVPLLLDPMTPANTDRTLVWEQKSKIWVDDINYAVRDDDFKLVVRTFSIFGATTATPRLFNIVTDPEETDDLLMGGGDPMAVDKREELEEIYDLWRLDTGLIDISGFDEQGQITTVLDQEGQLVVTASGGRLVLKRNPRLEISLDDFTFRAWIQPSKGLIDGTQVATIAEKAGSWELRITAANTLELTVMAVPCPGPVGCGETRTLEITTAMEKFRWYHVAFTTFHNFVAEERSQIVLYQWEFTEPSVAPVVLSVDNNDLPILNQTASRITVADNPAETDHEFRGKIFAPRFYHARLDEDQMVDFVHRTSLLSPCPAFENHQQYAGPVDSRGILGGVWTAPVQQGMVLSCCNPSQACNTGSGCVGANQTGPVNAGIGTACVRWQTGSPPGLFSCTMSHLGTAIEDGAGNEIFCCEAVGNDSLFVPLAGSSCQ